MSNQSHHARKLGFLLTLVFCAFLSATAQSGLQVTYGSKGIQTLNFNGINLEDTGLYPSDLFHIWHMKSTDLNGNVVSAGQFGWGENNNGESWNPSTSTETYTFSWGTIAAQFVQSGNNLNIIVTETNNAGSGILFDGAEIYPLIFHFPQDPAGFSGYSQYAITTTDPGVSVADFGSGIVTSVLPNEAVPMYGGWKNAGPATYSPILTSSAPDGLANFLPRNDVPVQPGSSFTYTLSLRFTPEGTPASASDAYASFAATYPSQMTWTDKRIFGTAYLSSSGPGSNINQPDGFPTNPRRYFNDPTVDITTPAGLQAFQDRMIAQAQSNANNTRQMNGQGVVTWDLEGEQYPQNTSYVCSPDQVATVAPEMESAITDTTSPWFGQKLDDAYFAIMSGAGLRTGVCLRPQVFTFGSGGTASQVFLATNAAIIANLENKARYANSRWGTTIFYVDSTVNSVGGTLDPAIFQQLIADLPSFLFIPEESTTRYYAYSAPFYSFIFHTTLGTSAATYLAYPSAFGANLVNDVSAATLATYTPQLTASVAKGDILMGHADYWQANDPALVSIYQAAGLTSPGNPQSTPAIAWTTPASIPYGAALSSTQLDATSNVTGTFTYMPAAGAILAAGSQTLMTTFTPLNSSTYRSATASVSLRITQATPAVTWAVPAPIVTGTALGATQLNATASVPGTFTYSPAAGTVPGVGPTTLQVTFTPTDSVDYASTTKTVSLTVTAVTQVAPTLTWSAPSAIVYGTALSSAQLNATASVPGTFTYSPASQTILDAGATILQATFTPTNGVNYKSATVTTNIQVLKATPTVSWPVPASITAGTAISSAQLNAAASVAGMFTYSPAAGFVPVAGAISLQVTFTPTNSLDYNPITQTVALIVTPASQTTPVVTWPPPASMVYGAGLSSTQLNASASVAGTFTYSPAAGTILNAGSTTLQVNFTPTNTTLYRSASLATTIQVTQAPPVITWTAPASIVAGTALSAAQLNASASVPGTFSYSPAAGAVLGAGTATLAVTFTPTNTTDYTTQTAAVPITVTPVVTGPVAILSPAASQVVSGTIFVSGQINVTMDSAGSFLIVDGVELGTHRVTGGPYVYPIDTTMLSNGAHILQLWAHDIGNNSWISSPVTIIVAN